MSSRPHAGEAAGTGGGGGRGRLAQRLPRKQLRQAQRSLHTIPAPQPRAAGGQLLGCVCSALTARPPRGAGPWETQRHLKTQHLLPIPVLPHALQDRNPRGKRTFELGLGVTEPAPSIAADGGALGTEHRVSPSAGGVPVKLPRFLQPGPAL